MNAHPLPPAGRTLATPPRCGRALAALATGCAALLLAASALTPVAAVAEPQAGGAHAAQTAKAKAPKTTQAAKRQPRKTSVGQAATPIPAAGLSEGAAQQESGARAVAFESGPGVLGVSLRTARQQQIKEYITEPVGLVALTFDDLRLAPVNKGDHVEVNLANRIQFDGKGDKVAAKSRRVLDVIARILTDNPETRVKVLVHTDDAGDSAANLRQSQKGADAVKQYLMSKGVSAERVDALGRGSTTPLSSKRVDRYRNKRVELHVEPVTPPGPPAAPPATPVPGAAAPTEAAAAPPAAAVPTLAVVPPVAPPPDPAAGTSAATAPPIPAVTRTGTPP